jgi:predicted helicase
MRARRPNMFLAIAVENKQHPKNRTDYRVWYLEVDETGQVVSVGAKSKQELIEHLFEQYRKTGKSQWRAFKKGAESSTPIEIFDFVSMNINENSHFGDLPTLDEFQKVLDTLQSRLEFRSIA